jgi:LuxR family maltose regulon positive regulatory protein
MALVNTLLHTFVGEFDAALTQRETTRALAEKATGVDDWIETLDALAMYCNVYAGRYREARDLADRLRATGTSAALTEILCPGVTSQAALLEGELDEAATLAAQALDAARRFHFDRHFFVFHALRTTSQLALERRDLPAALESAEWALSIVNSARPAFNFLAQVDRARIWAAGGDHDVALASLPQARAALRSENSVLMAKADELEARLRAALGDQRGALSAAGRLPDPRRIVVETVLALAAGDTAAAERVLAGAPATGSTTRLDVELQLLRANVALHRAGTEAPRHVRQALKHAHELGFVQTILDTAPQLIDHVVANPDVYPDFTELAQLARARSTMQTGASSRRTALVEPLTEAEIRVLAKLAERLSYAAIASELYLSLNTVKTHLRHAYIKLGVSSRSSAIARATTLGLL